MTWNETHRRWQALQWVADSVAEAAVVRPDVDPELPWDDELAAVFGTPEGLVEALQYRARLRREAQLDPRGGDEITSDELRMRFEADDRPLQAAIRRLGRASRAQRSVSHVLAS